MKEEDISDWATQSVGEQDYVPEGAVVDVTEVYVASVAASKRHLDKVDEAIVKLEEMTAHAAGLGGLERQRALENVGQAGQSIAAMATVQVALGAAYARLAKATKL